MKSTTKKATGKKIVKNVAARKAAGTAPKRNVRSKTRASKTRVKVRMYRQGLGDCFLITLPNRKKNRPYSILVDCGVAKGTPQSSEIMNRIARDIMDVTKGTIDLLVATHEHWDHISGFVQAKELFNQMQINKVWLAWTEDPRDDLANRLRAERRALRVALSMAATRMQIAGAVESEKQLSSLLDFYGPFAADSTKDALDAVKSLSPNLRYCRPTNEPVDLEETGARLYVLGPPHDEDRLRERNLSKKSLETYGLDEIGVFLAGMPPALSGSEGSSPFDVNFQIPLEASKYLLFFQNYFGSAIGNPEEKTGSEGGTGAREELDQSWRRIDASWLDYSTTMALMLDNQTNNTSLVLALELDGGDVLLFAADAQIGNWLSWQDLSWTIDGKPVTGPDLLKRVTLYKVGHHGSHNATLRENGLERMENLNTALIPVHQESAKQLRYNGMPFKPLVDRLMEITNGRVLRIDEPVPPALAKEVLEDDQNGLFYEITL